MQKHNLWLYTWLDRVKLLKRYESKIMVVAFVGTHIPLLVLLFYLVHSSAFLLETKLHILGIALIATLGGTLATLFILHNLLMPVSLTARSLKRYWAYREIPCLPTQFEDDAGVLMANASQVVRKLDDLLLYLANYDNLTGLPKRSLLQKHLSQSFSKGSSQPFAQAVFLIHFNGLQTLSSIKGSQLEDSVLRAVAQRSRHFCGESGFVAQLNHNEFAIAQSLSPASYSAAIQLTHDLLNTLLEPYQIEQETFHLTACMGVAFQSQQDDCAEQVLSHAGVALHRAKQQGNNCFEFYAADMTLRLQEHLYLENELRQAVANEQLHLHYQPQIDLRSGNMIGVECLLRWQHPELGSVSPSQFIPIAESTGLIVPLGQWVLQTACAQNKAWQQAGLPPIRMAINLSPLQFQQSDLVQQIRTALEQTGLDARYLELEVTESLAMENAAQTLHLLQELHQLGVSLALDDFGTGYSSLSYLRKFPFDILKIDRSFIQAADSSADGVALVEAIMALAGSLKLDLVAEGVETSSQVEFLRTAQGNNLSIQGFYFSPPLAAADLEQLLQQQSASPTSAPASAAAQLSYSLC
ncbi:MAG: putative bifunctional diguanylate cyclase/phosphodiesterase [Almyronema sp.]